MLTMCWYLWRKSNKTELLGNLLLCSALRFFRSSKVCLLWGTHRTRYSVHRCYSEHDDYSTFNWGVLNPSIKDQRSDNFRYKFCFWIYALACKIGQTREDGSSMTTFYYCSINYQSGLQSKTFSKLSYIFSIHQNVPHIMIFYLR